MILSFSNNHLSVERMITVNEVQVLMFQIVPNDYYQATSPHSIPVALYFVY